MFEYSDNGKTSLNISVSTDGGAFFRHTCSSCGLDFKTDFEEGQLAHRLSEEVAFVGDQMGYGLDPLTGDLNRTLVHCPYCGYECEPEDLITEERWAYVGGVIDELYIRPMMDRLSSSFKGLGRSSGLISVSVTTTNSVPSPSPLEGPEVPDMIPVSLLCCGRRVKVLPKWRDLSVCPYCQTPIRVE
ncbi:MAG: hypothetical protein AAGK21_05615 [Bacteroidota bacterium]